MTPVSASMRTAASSPLTATHTEDPDTAVAMGPCPTGIVATTAPEGSTCVTVPSTLLATQAPDFPTATPVGTVPTSIRPRRRPEDAAMRVSTPPGSTTHTDPSPVATGRTVANFLTTAPTE